MADAVRFGLSLDDVAIVIYQNFFTGWTRPERGRFYANIAKRKRSGRPISRASRASNVHPFSAPAA